MATRRNIRDAFYSELLSAATGSHTVTYGDGSTDTISLTDDDVRLLGPDALESIPAVVYDEDYTTRAVNGVGTAPVKFVRDNTGVVTEEVWREYVTASFVVTIEATSEIEKEPVYESIRTQFARYNTGGWDERDLHADIENVEIGPVSSTDFTNADATIRADEIEVLIDFHRDFVQTGDAIESVEVTIDADTDDATTGTSYTVN